MCRISQVVYLQAVFVVLLHFTVVGYLSILSLSFICTGTVPEKLVWRIQQQNKVKQK